MTRALALLLPLLLAPSAAAEPSTEKPTLYVFFATWCVPCRVELPHIQGIYDRHRESGIEVVLVSEDEPSTAQDIPGFLARYSITVPWVLDDESEILERYNPTAGIPFAALVAASGRVVYAHSGYEPGDEKRLEAEVAALVARPLDSKAESRAQLSAAMQSLGVWRTSQFEEMDSRLGAAIGRLEVAGRDRRYRASVRIDGAVLDDAAGIDDGRDARLERVQLAADFGRVALLAGDDYVSFGHGVSLSLRKVDPLGLDTALRGGRIDVELGRFRALGIAGVSNPQNLDPLDLNLVDDDSDLIGGVELSAALGESSTISPYTLFISADGAAPDGMDIDWRIGGASASHRGGILEVAAEAAIGQRRGLTLADETASAAFVSVQLMTGPITARLSAKSYRHWLIGRGERALLYHEAPSLEREDQEVPSNQDATGARARVEWRLPEQTTLFASTLAYRYSEDGSDPLDGDLALHGYVGIDKRFNSGLSTNGQTGYRLELREDDSEKLSLWQVDADISMPLRRAFAATLKWNHRSETKNLIFDELSFVRGLAVAGFSRSGLGALSLVYGYSTESTTTPTHYPGGELLVHLPKGGSARVFVGSLTGGRICVSGSCRDVPPFRGGRLDLTLRF